MEELLEDSDSSSYGHSFMKDILLDHFQNQIIITEVNGKPNVVSLIKTTADKILREFHSQSFEENPEAEKISIIGQAVMQAARPRAIISSLQIGLAVRIHHSFASRFLIDSLNCWVLFVLSRSAAIYQERLFRAVDVMGGDRPTRLHLHHYYFVYSLVLFLILVLFT